MGWIRIFSLGVGLVLLIRSVNSSATCVEKFLGGQTAATKHEVIEGERLTLRCDVTARDPNKDMVYWKFDDEVMSQDNTVIPKYQSKFNVKLEPDFNGTGIDIYTLSWIAELDDAGKYNCTCTTGGIQYPVWIKRPCNRRKHVIQTNPPTSEKVIDYLKRNTSYQLQEGVTFEFKVGLDCNCTWPEVNRTFIGKWYRDCTDDPNQHCAKDNLKNQLTDETGFQNSSITPIGCYTGKGSVTYRYRNVFGSFANIEFKCPMATRNKTYNFYTDEGEKRKKPEEQDTIMSIHCKGLCNPCPSNGIYKGKPCTESKDKIKIDYSETIQMMSIKPDVCSALTVLFNDRRVDSTTHINGILVMSQFDKKCNSPSCLREFKCRIPGIYKLNHGKDTLFEVHCAEGLCERCPSNGIYNRQPCTESKGKIKIKYNENMQMMNIIPDACSATTVLFNNGILVMSQFDKKCNSPSCLWDFKCQIPGIYKLNHGKETLYEIDCEAGFCEPCPSNKIYKGIPCSESKDKIKINYNETIQMMNIKPHVCNATTVLFNNGLLDSTSHVNGILVMSQFDKKCNSPSCLWEFKCQIPGIYKLNHGKETLYEIDCESDADCADVIHSLEIVLMVTGPVVFICIVAAFVNYCYSKRQTLEDAKKPKNTKGVFIAVIIVVIIVVLAGAVASAILITQRCSHIAQLLPLGVLIGIAIVLFFAALIIVISSVCLCRLNKTGKPDGKYSATNQRLSTVSQISNSSTFPLEQGQIMVSTTPYPGNPNLANGDINGIFNPAYSNKRSAYEELSSSRTQSKEKDIANDNIPLEYKESVSDYQQLSKCKVCSENPVIGYLTPCNHGVVCKGCAMEMMKRHVAYCPECGIEVDHYHF